MKLKYFEEVLRSQLKEMNFQFLLIAKTFQLDLIKQTFENQIVNV